MSASKIQSILHHKNNSLWKKNWRKYSKTCF